MIVKKKILMSLLLVLTACTSPQNIVLNDGTIIPTRDKVNYDKGLSAFKYENSDGKDIYINKDSVKMILPVGEQIPRIPLKPVKGEPKTENYINIYTQPTSEEMNSNPFEKSEDSTKEELKKDNSEELKEINSREAVTS